MGGRWDRENVSPKTAMSIDSASYFVDIYIGVCGSVVKNRLVNAGDVGSIPGSGRSLGKGNGNLLQ